MCWSLVPKIETTASGSKWGGAIRRLGLIVLLLAAPATARAAAKPTIYVYDLTWASSLPADQRYDLRHVAVCIQALANREAPRVFLKFFGDDGLWLYRLRESGGLCEGWPTYEVSDVYELFDLLQDYVNGVVVYDPDPNTGVISTSLVATTVAGADGAIAVRKDPAPGSMYDYLVNDADGPQLPVLIDLTGKFTGSGTIWQTSTPSTGSAKCDAYIWAKEKYIDTGKCDPTLLSYTLDLWGLKVGADLGTQLNNLDYAISRQGFCFELSPWGDEIPNDDPGQPLGTDLNTFKTIMNACNTQTGQSEMIKLCGFVNWSHKYTDHVGGSHGDVETEWQMTKLLSAYNVYQEADAIGMQYITNSSFYAGLRPALAGRHYVQNPPPTYDDMVARGLISGGGSVVAGNYIMIGLGDYDQASWTLYWLAGSRYDDSNRGQVYCNWAVDPNAVDRASVAMDYMYRNKSEKDYFVAWDSGAGYVTPTKLYGSRSPSGYPSGTAIWQQHCREYYRMFDYSISAWLLNCDAGTMNSTTYQIYLPFSGDGIGTYAWADDTDRLQENVPVHPWFGDLSSSSGPVIDYSSGVHFAWYRTVIWTPTKLKTLESNYAGSGHNHRFLDAYTFNYLYRYYKGGSNNYRATWVSDTVPRVMAAGQTYPVTVTVRNDGWDTWSEADSYRLSHAAVPAGGSCDPVQVVDNDGLHSARERSGSIYLSCGLHPIKVTFFEKTGDAILEVRYEGPGIGKQLIPDSALYRGGGENGLDYAYYEGSWNNLPDFDSLTPVETGVISNFSLSPAQQSDYFGFKYTGYVEVPADGLYTFYTTSDDGSKLYLGGAEYADRYLLPAGASVAPGQSVVFSFDLTAPAANGPYDLYFDMVRESVTWFRHRHNLEFKKEIVVATNEGDVDTDGDGFSDVWEEANGGLYWHPDDGLVAGRAFDPSPANRAQAVSPVPVLNWTAGLGATSHDVYFGALSPGTFQGNQTETTFEPGLLEGNTTYYWRIDEINAGETVTGSVWSFITRGNPDFDGDGDVDQRDFGHLQACLTGSGVAPADPECQDAILDSDGDVDQYDLGILQACMSGPNVPLDPACTD